MLLVITLSSAAYNTGLPLYHESNCMHLSSDGEKYITDTNLETYKKLLKLAFSYTTVLLFKIPISQELPELNEKLGLSPFQQNLACASSLDRL